MHNKENRFIKQKTVYYMENQSNSDLGAVSSSINVPPTRVRFWRNIHDDTTVVYGSVIDQTETHYIVIPDDDIRSIVKWLKFKCDALR